MEAEFKQLELSAEDVLAKLKGKSPLQLSKALIDIELHDKKAAEDIISEVYEQFDQGSLSDELITPVILSLCDGLLGIKKLGLSKMGLNATRLHSEISSFSYSTHSLSEQNAALEKINLDENSKSNKDDKGKYKRDEIEDTDLKDAYRDKHFDGKNGTKKVVHSELEQNADGSKKQLRRQSDRVIKEQKAKGNKSTGRVSNTDHTVPLKQVFDDFGSSVALSKDDLKAISGIDANLAVISEEINKSKGAKTWQESVNDYEQLARKENPTAADKKQLKKQQKIYNDKTKAAVLKEGKEAQSALESKANKTVLENITKDTKLIKGAAKGAANQAKDESVNKGLGNLILLIIKPLFFEVTDAIQNGIQTGMPVSSTAGAFAYRMKRCNAYVMENMASLGMASLKDLILGFTKYLINAIIDMFVGLLKKALKIISEGFNAIVQAVKIMTGEGSKAQKADAITKLLATTVTTYVVFALEVSILPTIGKMPFGDILTDVASIVLSGVASTLVVWLIDKADLFSVKPEKRMLRIKEIFESRIEQLKKNTDAYETTAIEHMAKQKIQFTAITERMTQAIKNNEPVSDSVLDVADFMQIDLKVRAMDDFMALLSKEEPLVV